MADVKVPVARLPQTSEHARPVRRRRARSSWRRLTVLCAGAFVFLFPFYYMIIGSLQATENTSPSGVLPDPHNMTLANYRHINQFVNLFGSLVNSGIFTGGVILSTVVFGSLAGYALAQLRFRGRGTLFNIVLLVQVVPFQLLMIPLYVLIARDYGLTDSYLGMILPFAINSTAVLIFRQYFVQLPRELFDAARIDGGSELQILLRVALPLIRPALLTAGLITFIGPWNEFLWPFLITKQQSMEPLAVSLSNYITTLSAEAGNPFGAILAGACVLAAPAVALFLLFQRHFVSSNLGSAVKG